ncbi:hypothetical protein D9M70_369000 [compost metagenome]
MLLDVFGAGADQLRRTLLAEEPQAAAHRLQAERHVGQMQLVATGLQIGGDRPLGQGQSAARLIHHHDARLDQLMLGEGLRLVDHDRHLPRLAPLAALEVGDHAFHEQHGIGQLVHRREIRDLAVDPVTDRRQLRAEGGAGRGQADHAQGLAQLGQLAVQGGEAVRLGGTALDQVEQVLDARQFLADRR